MTKRKHELTLQDLESKYHLELPKFTADLQRAGYQIKPIHVNYVPYPLRLEKSMHKWIKARNGTVSNFLTVACEEYKDIWLDAGKPDLPKQRQAGVPTYAGTWQIPVGLYDWMNATLPTHGKAGFIAAAIRFRMKKETEK